MMADTRETRASACEIKFLIDGRLAPRLREWAREHLNADPHGGGPCGDEYKTTTIYFDTPALDVFHRRSSFGRAKYRVRRYGSADVVFFERKLRKPGVLIKRRTIDGLAEMARLEADDADPAWQAHWFQRRVQVRQLRPVCQVTYERTARVGATADGLARMTLDTSLRALPVERPAFVAAPGATFFEGRAILELKYRARVPAVFRRLIEEFALKPETASKYRLALAAIRPADCDGTGEACRSGDASPSRLALRRASACA